MPDCRKSAASTVFETEELKAQILKKFTLSLVSKAWAETCRREWAARGIDLKVFGWKDPPGCKNPGCKASLTEAEQRERMLSDCQDLFKRARSIRIASRLTSRTLIQATTTPDELRTLFPQGIRIDNIPVQIVVPPWGRREYRTTSLQLATAGGEDKLTISGEPWPLGSAVELPTFVPDTATTALGHRLRVYPEDTQNISAFAQSPPRTTSIALTQSLFGDARDHHLPVLAVDLDASHRSIHRTAVPAMSFELHAASPMTPLRPYTTLAQSLQGTIESGLQELGMYRCPTERSPLDTACFASTLSDKLEGVEHLAKTVKAAESIDKWPTAPSVPKSVNTVTLLYPHDQFPTPRYAEQVASRLREYRPDLAVNITCDRRGPCSGRLASAWIPCEEGCEEPNHDVRQGRWSTRS